MSTQRIAARATRFAPLAGIVLLSCLCALSGVAVAAEEVARPSGEEGVDATIQQPVRKDVRVVLVRGQAIDVVNPYGSVRLRYGNIAHTLEYRSILQQPAGAAEIAIDAAAKGDRYLIAPRLPKDAVLAEGQRLDLVLYVPEGHVPNVETTFGSIDSRDVASDVVLRSASGDISVRGTRGAVAAETDGGRIEAMLANVAPAGSRQSLRTRSGAIIVGVGDRLGAEVVMSTSAMIGSDYSVSIEHDDRSEPDKTGRSRIGVDAGTEPPAHLELRSLIGDIRLLRIAELLEP